MVLLRDQPSQPALDVKRLLRAVPLFADASERELQAVVSVARETTFAPGSVICAEGATGLGLHVIAAGTVVVRPGGGRSVRLGPGAYFGEIALIDGGPRMATVVAETEVRTVAVLAWEFTAILHSEPSVTRRMLEQLCARLRHLDGTLGR